MNKYREALNHIISRDREDCGVSNLSDAYRNDISILSELIQRYEDEGLIEWHPYPQEKPERNGKYLVLVIVFEEDPHGPHIREDYWTCSWRYNRKPIAWAEMPKLYERE